MSVKNQYGAAETAKARHETYSSGFKKMTNATILMALTTLVSVGAMVFALNSKPEARYFAARDDGGILPMVPIDAPFLNDGQVTNFAVEAITRALTINFANWRTDMSDASEYFVKPSGWNNYLTAIEGAGLLDDIRNNRLVSTAVANGATIVRAGLDQNGTYSWTVQIPLTVTYESSSEAKRESLIAEIILSRIPTWQMPSGIGISQLVVRRGRA